MPITNHAVHRFILLFTKIKMKILLGAYNIFEQTAKIYLKIEIINYLLSKF